MVGGPSPPKLACQSPDSQPAFVWEAENQAIGRLIWVGSEATHHIYYSSLHNQPAAAAA